MSATALQAKDQIEEGLKDWDPAKDDKAEVSCFISWPMLLCTALCSCAFAPIQPWVIVMRDEIVQLGLQQKSTCPVRARARLLCQITVLALRTLRTPQWR